MKHGAFAESWHDLLLERLPVCGGDQPRSREDPRAIRRPVEAVVADPEPFTVDKLVGKRNEVLKANVPGMFDNTYMTTADYVRPEMKFLSYHDHHFAQLRGFWEVEGDFMGGPFVSHSFYSKDGRDIIVLEGWVYAPKYDKRQYLRQVESFLYSFEWDKDEDPAGAGEDEGKK